MATPVVTFVKRAVTKAAGGLVFEEGFVGGTGVAVSGIRNHRLESSVVAVEQVAYLSAMMMAAVDSGVAAACCHVETNCSAGSDDKILRHFRIASFCVREGMCRC